MIKNRPTNFWCKLGLHKWEYYMTWATLRMPGIFMKGGGGLVGTISTKDPEIKGRRCVREGCREEQKYLPNYWFNDWAWR